MLSEIWRDDLQQETFEVHEVWDKPTRIFHWVNVLCIIGLAGIGLVILNAKILGVATEGKILLKTAHVWIGYVFALNLAVRIYWGFAGNRFARWRAVLPGGSGYVTSVIDYIGASLRGKPEQHLGHNPVGRLSVTVMLILLTAQAITGLVLAGTDIFYPPIGSWIAGWIAAEGVDPGSLMPYAKETYDAEAYSSMRVFRKPFITIHLYSFYSLLVIITLHIIAVVVTETKEGSNLISAMFTGKKTLTKSSSEWAKSGED